MARSRNIKPALFDNELLGEIDPIYTLLFIGLWTLADKSGRLEDRSKRIKAKIFPYREIPNLSVLLGELHTLGFIDRYKVDGLEIIQIVNFDKHQNPHRNEKKSELPEKPMNKGSQNDSSNVPIKSEQKPTDSGPLGLIPDSLNTDSLNLIPDTGLIDTEVQAELEKKSINHSILLKCFSDFGFPMNYRTDPKVIAGAKDLFSRGMSADVFTEVIQTAVDEKTGNGLPSWNFIQSIADNLIVKKSSSGRSRKMSTHGDFAKRDYAGDPALSKYNVAGVES